MRYFLILFLLLFTYNADAWQINIADKAIYEVNIPKTKQQKEKGLMNVHYLPENKGMLFDVRGYPYAAMWMKNTYIPLDMVFIDCDFIVSDIYKNAEPLSLKKISSDKPFCYILEINGGQTDLNKIEIGDRAYLSAKE